MSAAGRPPRAFFEEPVRRCALLLPAALLLALLAAGAPAAAAPVPERLLEAYEASLARRDEVGYAAQRRALDAIAELRTPEAHDALAALLARYGDDDPRRAALLLGAFVRYGSPQDLDDAIRWVERRRNPLLSDLLHTIVAEVRLPATRAHLRGPALTGATPRVKAEIIRALGLSGDPHAGAALLPMVRETNLLVRVEALEALARLKDPKAFVVIQVFLRDPQQHVRAAAARALGILGDTLAVGPLEGRLQDESPLVVEAAAGALGRLDDVRAVPSLLDALARVQGKDLRVADAITQALQAISGKDIQADAELWRAWWLTVKDRKPFVKAKEKPGSHTVPGPTWYGFPVRSSRVVFVLDVSRSMGWNGRLESAQKELVQVLEHLPETTRFNLIVFSDRIYTWHDGLSPAKPSRVRRAVAFVRQQRPLRGTNTYGALARAFQDPDADTIFLLSDGHPSTGRITDPELILAQVRDWNRFRRVRIHGVALLRGSPPPAYASLEDPKQSLWFMQRLCKQNDGRFKEVH
jgi:HEAT repeat protein